MTKSAKQNRLNIDLQSTTEILTIINDEDHVVAKAIKQVVPVIAEVVDLIWPRLQNGGRLIYCGAGSSGRIGMLDAAEMDPTFNVGDNKIIGLMAGGNRAFGKAVEGAEDDKEAAIADLKALNLTTDDIVLGIAASGTTPYVLSGLQFAKSVDALTIGLCMSQSKVMDQDGHKVIRVLTGQEVIRGSSRMKAGSATKMVLNMISTALMIKLGKVYQNLMVDVKASNAKLINRAISIVGQVTKAPAETVVKALQASNYSCSHAIVMIIKHVSFADSQSLLIKHDGKLRAIIG